jgi:hypothetical protein
LFPGLVERRWQEAVGQGDLVGLRGAGRPLAWEEDALVPPQWQLAFHLLKTSGLAPAWIELDREIRLGLEGALNSLTAAYAEPCTSEATRRTARERFASQAAEINQQIGRLNLVVPHAMFQRSPVCALACIAAVAGRHDAREAPARTDRASCRTQSAAADPSPHESRGA